MIEYLRRCLTHKRTATTLLAGFLVLASIFFIGQLSTLYDQADLARKLFADPAHQAEHHGSSPHGHPSWEHNPPAYVPTDHPSDYAHHTDNPPGPAQNAPPPHEASTQFSPISGEYVVPKDENAPFHLKNEFPSPDARRRYEGVQAWRQEEDMVARGEHQVRKGRPHRRPPRTPRKDFSSTGEFLEEQLPVDYPPGENVHKVFLMLKTGAQVLWDRLPIHLLTTLTRVPNFAIYSDKEGSIAGHEIINILRDLPEGIVNDNQLSRYRAVQQMHAEHWGWDASELKASGAWEIDKFKNMPMLAHAYETSPDSEWFVFIDDDSYVFMENFVDYVSTFDYREPYYLGSPAMIGFDGKPLAFAHGGSVVVLSKGTMDKLFGPGRTMPVNELLAKYAEEALGTCCGDALVAVALYKEHNITLHDQGYGRYVGIGTRFQGNTFENMVFVPGLMSQPIITWHHVSPRDVELLWEYEKLRGHGANITYSDIYINFVLPYICDEKENWDLDGEDRVFKPDTEEQVYRSDDTKKEHPLQPHSNKEDCITVCKEDKACSGWSFQSGLCKLSTRGIQLGKASNSFNSDENHKVSSGWMIDRIRNWRTKEPADPLTYDEATGKWNDSEDTREGWFLRKAAKEQSPYFSDASSIQGDL